MRIKLLLLFLTLPLFALDQFTKWLIVRTIPYETAIAVIPGFFDLVYVTNTGAAFSMFSDSNHVFIGLSVVTLVALVIFYLRGAFSDRWTQIALALLVAGILGNLTDRLLHQHVIDFLSFNFHVPYADPWPSFNIADSCICIAAAIFIIQSFFEDKKFKS